MRELSLHILDIVQNSLKAGADKIIIDIDESSQQDLLAICITDNGCGMDAEMVAKAVDPFVTTRTTRKVGLGLSMFKAAAQRCNGDLVIESEPGKGTKVSVTFQYKHIDRAPLGDILNTILVIITCNPQVALEYTHIVDGKSFEFSTEAIKNELGDVALNHPMVVDWIKGFIRENLDELYGGEN